MRLDRNTLAPSNAALVRRAREDGIAVVRIDVPGESQNTLQAEFAEQANELLDELHRDPALKGAARADEHSRAERGVQLVAAESQVIQPLRVLRLAHPHWQLIATPVVPPDQARRDGVASRYFDAHKRPLASVLLEAELGAGDRIIEENGDWVALVPYAARFPYEVWLVPRRPTVSLLGVDAGGVDALSQLLPRVLGKFRAVLATFDYNIVSVTAPGCARRKEHFGYHLQILPRLASPAGFELGSGMWINSKLPEDAARELRDASPAT